MSELMTMKNIASMYRLPVDKVRDVVVKLPGFPPEAVTSTPRNRLWIRAQVRDFKPLLKDAIAKKKQQDNEVFFARNIAIDARSLANRRHHGNKRRTAEMLRTPAWADMAAIEEVYRAAVRLESETGVRHHVDHVIPLQGKLVSGLHVAANLEPIPWRENIRKSNRFEVSP